MIPEQKKQQRKRQGIQNVKGKTSHRNQSHQKKRNQLVAIRGRAGAGAGALLLVLLILLILLMLLVFLWLLVFLSTIPEYQQSASSQPKGPKQRIAQGQDSQLISCHIHTNSTQNRTARSTKQAVAKLIAHEPTSCATKQRRPEAPVALRSYSTRLSLLVWRCAAVVCRALAAATLRVLLLLGRVGRVAAILGRLSVSRTALGRVLALLVLWGVCLVALAALLIVRSWMLAVLGLAISLLAL